ncbi:MAG: 2-amino-4-hydroxy-6-hydroxymethyldihydropteridine diphosphokinase [Leptospirales bacterium]|jgi:2-amino-4-hydroxy-6-hydroxymethyldihydropteridine diphosphokinase
MSSSHTISHQAFVSVGSNIEPQKHVERAAEILADEHALLDRSRLIQTAPDGFQDQPDFLNGAFWIETCLEYDAFNAYLKGLEKRLGRVKGPIKSGPRTIDLDIIVWDGRVRHSDYPAKDYTRDPIDELLRKHGIQLTSPT